MTSSKIWMARRVGDRILCGRQVDGRYVCPMGEIAKVAPLIHTSRWRSVRRGFDMERGIVLPPGLKPDPPLEAGDAAHWVPTSRARQQIANERHNPGNRRRRPYGRDRTTLPAAVGVPEVPFTRDCPKCQCTIRVTAALSVVLDSPE
jgi:hypothetical protein